MSRCSARVDRHVPLTRTGRGPGQAHRQLRAGDRRVGEYGRAELLNGDGSVEYDYNHHNARRINRLLVKTNLRGAQKRSAPAAVAETSH